MFPENAAFIRLSSGYVFKEFDCGDPDLNDFLRSDSKLYQNQLLAVTYILENDQEIIAYCSLSNDKINSEQAASKSSWRKISGSLVHRKRRRSYPAIKIGRLAVNLKYKDQKIGTALVDYLNQLFLDGYKAGCKFITVDAYSASLNFYLKNGFQFLTDKDEGMDTRLMY